MFFDAVLLCYETYTGVSKKTNQYRGSIVFVAQRRRSARMLMRQRCCGDVSVL